MTNRSNLELSQFLFIKMCLCLIKTTNNLVNLSNKQCPYIFITIIFIYFFVCVNKKIESFFAIGVAIPTVS